MILAMPEMENTISVEPGFVAALIIENPSFFRTFVLDLYRQQNGEHGKIVLSRDYELLNPAKTIEMIDSFVSIHLNRKSLLTKICSILEQSAITEHSEATFRLLRDMENYFYDLAQDFPCDLEFSKINAASLIKMAGVSLRDDYENPLEQLIDYMELIRELEGEKLFVFINMRAYFSQEAMEAFAQTAMEHEYLFLLVDNMEYPRLKKENRLVIDSDLCEF